MCIVSKLQLSENTRQLQKKIKMKQESTNKNENEVKESTRTECGCIRCVWAAQAARQVRVSARLQRGLAESLSARRQLYNLLTGSITVAVVTGVCVHRRWL